MFQRISHLKFLIITAGILSVLLCSYVLIAQDLEENEIAESRQKSNGDTIFFEADHLASNHLYVNTPETKESPIAHLDKRKMHKLIRAVVIAETNLNHHDSNKRAQATSDYIVLSRYLKNIIGDTKGWASVSEPSAISLLPAESAPEVSEGTSTSNTLPLAVGEQNANEKEEEVEREKDNSEALKKKAQEELLKARKEREKYEKALSAESNWLKEQKEKGQKEREAATAANETKNVDKQIKEDLPPKEELKAEFSSQKGQLPWPVSLKRLINSYGERTHPGSQDLPTVNNGIDVQTSPGASVKAVFDGKVLFITHQQPYETIIAIDHGGYTSVYYFMEQVAVSKGASIKQGQVIGKVISQDRVPNFHFEIWRGQEQINPATWLKR